MKLFDNEMTDYNGFMDGSEAAIEKGVRLKDNGDIGVRVSDAAEAVIEYLEQEGIVMFTEEN